MERKRNEMRNEKREGKREGGRETEGTRKSEKGTKRFKGEGKELKGQRR